MCAFEKSKKLAGDEAQSKVLLTPVEAAQFLRLDETRRHTPKGAIRTLTYFRERGELKATKYAHQVWFRREELLRFLEAKTEG
ncbi:MAG: helix-turn-helix domain-containing protein [Verrucomicrobia bacterium]|nr:helix-turn-helix domain-containing protein [Verrucomicrobiota bacterium]